MHVGESVRFYCGHEEAAQARTAGHNVRAMRPESRGTQRLAARRMAGSRTWATVRTAHSCLHPCVSIVLCMASACTATVACACKVALLLCTISHLVPVVQYPFPARTGRQRRPLRRQPTARALLRQPVQRPRRLPPGLLQVGPGAGKWGTPGVRPWHSATGMETHTLPRGGVDV